MKEVVVHEAGLIHLSLPVEAVAGFAETRAALARRSAIVWGEHCSECAFPACYSSCQFYTPRSDLHCRRFANGIERVALSPAGAPGLSRIRFRRWGKLEGSGPPHLFEADDADDLERAAARHDRLVSALPLPRRAVNAAAHHLNRMRKSCSLSDAAPLPEGGHFVIESWLEQPGTITLTLSMMPWSKASDGLFQKQITFEQGYNRIVIPNTSIRQSLRLEAPFAIQIEIVGEPPNQPIVFGLLDFVELATGLSEQCGSKPSAANTHRPGSKTAKCVVWDLDDTIWTGTLVEDGVEGVVLKPEIADAMRMLDARGVLNSVASKNDAPLALEALERFGLRDLILFPQISWEPKSDAIRRIAQSLDIGIDTLVFVDDQAFERGEVAASHPEVAIFAPKDVAGFETHALFDVPVTAESRKRRLLYRDEEQRQSAASSAGADYLGFLRSCRIELEVSRLTRENAERVHELTQRTNQLNVTGARFTREEVQGFIDCADPREGFVLRCRDAFGDYGVIGFCVASQGGASVDAFFMSCRVQRKRVEHAFFAWLGDRLVRRGCSTLAVTYRQTAKNGASVRMFADLGFELQQTASGDAFKRRLTLPWTDADIVHVAAPVFDRVRETV